MSNLSPFFLQRFCVALAAPAVLLAGTLLMPSMVAAQTILGTIQGYVGDLDGRPLAGAEVSLLETATGARRSSRSDHRGFFTVRGLQPGSYRITASYQGVEATRETDVPLGVAQILDVELRIDLAAVAADITVTGTPPLVETSRSGAASYIDSDQIRHLPIVGRDFKQFAILAPTVQEGARGSVTMSGQREIARFTPASRSTAPTPRAPSSATVSAARLLGTTASSWPRSRCASSRSLPAVSASIAVATGAATSTW
jgi:hypothetical protein